ncbi:hypothetical protein [Paenibacillus sp. Y412MC10]|nr:hypothetical protein [Paenibacillus sp. Y412MC10]
MEQLNRLEGLAALEACKLKSLEAENPRSLGRRYDGNMELSFL